VTSSARSPFDSPRPLSYRLPIVTYPLAPLVFEIFDLKVADKQNSTLSDNKGRLKLSAREPIISLYIVIFSNLPSFLTCLTVELTVLFTKHKLMSDDIKLLIEAGSLTQAGYSGEAGCYFLMLVKT